MLIRPTELRVLLDRVGLIRRSRHQAIVLTQKAKNPTVRLGFSEFGRCQRMTCHCVARPAGRCCATFSRCAQVEPPPRRFSSSLLQMQKTPPRRGFQIWSVIEDSNLRPLRPERSALPGCANHRMRGASYCRRHAPSIPSCKKAN